MILTSSKHLHPHTGDCGLMTQRTMYNAWEETSAQNYAPISSCKKHKYKYLYAFFVLVACSNVTLNL